MTPRVHIIIEQLARMRVAGIKDNVIAAKLGMSQSGLSRILALPEYREIEEAVLMGVVSKQDKELAGRIAEQRDYVRQAVPTALRALVETVTQSRDLRTKLAAAKELLDRDPDKTFSINVGRAAEQASAVSSNMLDEITVDADKVALAVATKPSGAVN